MINPLADADAFENLRRQAFEMGASDAAVLPARDVPTDPALAKFCKSCDGFGRTRLCPPLGLSPQAFSKLLSRVSHALVFKIDVPLAVLMTDDRHAFFQTLHCIAAGMEGAITSPDAHPGRHGGNHRGGITAHGFAGGSCKPLFCAHEPVCPALADKKGRCRHPGKARPSLSGVGVHVFDLAATLGWQMPRIPRPQAPLELKTGKTKTGETDTGMLVGLVLFDARDRRFP